MRVNCLKGVEVPGSEIWIGYTREEIRERDRKIWKEHTDLGFPVAKLAIRWDLSQESIRRILRAARARHAEG